MSQRIRYVGLDISKDTSAVAVAVAEPGGSVVGYGAITNDPGAIRRLVEKLSREADARRPTKRDQPATRCTGS